MKINLSRNARTLLTLSMLRIIVDLFLDNYVTTMISKLTGGNMIMISYYYIVMFICTVAGAALIGKFVKSHYLGVLRCGITVNVLFFLLFIYLKNNIFYFAVLASLQGLSLGCYYLPIQFASSNWISPKDRHKYSSITGILGQVLKIILPVLLGGIIVKNNYKNTGIYMFMVVLLQLAVTLIIKEEKTTKQITPYSLPKYFKIIALSKNMKLFWIMCFFRGIALLGAQRQLINLLIFEQNNEFELGKITSVISIITIILFYGFGKFVSSKQYKRVLLLSTILQLVSVFALIILEF